MADSVASQIESADAVIGLVPPPSRDNHAVENTIARIVETPVALKIALLHPPLSPTQAEPSRVNSHWHLIATPQLMQDPSSLAQSLGDRFVVLEFGGSGGDVAVGADVRIRVSRGRATIEAPERERGR